jgi:acetylornithine deacetylase
MGTPRITDLSWIVWCYPGAAEKEFFKEFEEFWKDVHSKDEVLKPFDLRVHKQYHFVKPWETDIENGDIRLLQKVYADVLKKEPEISGAPFSCDMAVYGEAGDIPVVILGPSGDNLHGSDEWVSLEDVFSLTEIFARFIFEFYNGAENQVKS